MNRFDRNERFFGAEGQRRLRGATVAVVGAGGLGSHVVQQLAHLGVGRLVVIDPDIQTDSGKNRNVGSEDEDPDAEIPKVDVAERLVKRIDPSIVVEKIHADVRSEQALRRLETVGYVFGCVDNDGTRLVLTEHCLAFDRPYFDLATDIHVEDGTYGGRVFVTINGSGCLVCQGELDPIEAREDLEGKKARQDRIEIYGIPVELLAEPGPAVVSINGVVASLAVTEFMLMASGVRPPQRLLEYRADQGIVKRKVLSQVEGCYYCQEIYGLGERAATLRYVNTAKE
jgi:hypothetical protein